ncbi:endothelin-converting enzyme 2-like [Amblyomma americanum]
MLPTIEVPPGGQSATEKAAGLFRACVRLGSDPTNSEAGSLKRFFAKLGLDLSKENIDPRFDIVARITQLSLEYGFPTFVKLSSHNQPQDNEKSLDMRINKADEDWMRGNHASYRPVRLARVYSNSLLLYDSRLDSAGLADRIIKAEAIVLAFITAIRRSYLPPPIRATTVRGVGRFTQGYVSAEFWVSYIGHSTEFTFKATDTLYVRENATGLVVLLLDDTRLSRNDSRLLLAWSLLHQLLPYAHGRKMVELAQSRYHTRRDPVGEFCYATVSKVMAVGVSQRYFRTSMEYKINETDWIDEGVWCLMIEKAKKLFVKIEYPEELASETLADALYASIPDVGVDFFHPYLESHRLLTIRDVRGNVAGDINTATANAAYSSELHSVFIYAGLLQPPVFINDGPAAMNYGGLGQIASHEMMHSLDASNIYYDYRRNKASLGSTQTMKLYTARAESASRARTISDVTDSEGFVDWAGIQIAYAAYRRLPLGELDRGVPDVGLSAEQLFFVSYCLKWCTGVRGTRRDPRGRYWHGRSRCMVPLQNMPEFAKAFNCKQGDVMSPKNRCQFW